MLALFVVETSKNNKSDWMYIKQYLDTHFQKNPNDVVRPIYMAGKGNYSANRIMNEIDKQTRNYKSQVHKDMRIIIFLCIDIDDTTSSDNAKANEKKAKEIKDFCVKKGYNFIWFYKDIENVFLGHSVINKNKMEAAQKFLRNSKIINIEKFKYNDYSSCINGSSNLHTILLKYFIT